MRKPSVPHSSRLSTDYRGDRMHDRARNPPLVSSSTPRQPNPHGPGSHVPGSHVPGQHVPGQHVPGSHVSGPNREPVPAPSVDPSPRSDSAATSPPATRLPTASRPSQADKSLPPHIECRLLISEILIGLEQLDATLQKWKQGGSTGSGRFLTQQPTATSAQDVSAPDVSAPDATHEPSPTSSKSESPASSGP